jgi:hypothetical protein
MKCARGLLAMRQHTSRSCQRNFVDWSRTSHLKSGGAEDELIVPKMRKPRGQQGFRPQAGGVGMGECDPRTLKYASLSFRFRP